MSVFNQTNDGDLVLTNGQLTLKDGPEECAIRVRNRLFTIRGEWFADTSIGIPYQEVVFVGNPDFEIIRTVFTAAIESVPGVAALEDLQMNLDKDTRNLAVTMQVRHDSGALIVGGSGEPFRVEI